MTKRVELILVGWIAVVTLVHWRDGIGVEGKATVEQMKKTGEMIRNVCIGKIKISEEMANVLKEPNFPDNKELKCYVNCIMEMMQVVKKGKLNYEASLKQIDLIMPDELADPMRKALDICRTVSDGIKNNCEASYAIAECLAKNNPKFVFP